MITLHNAGWFRIECQTSHGGPGGRQITNNFSLDLGQTHTFDHDNQSLEIWAFTITKDLVSEKRLLKRIEDVNRESYGIIAHGTAFNPWLEINE